MMNSPEPMTLGSPSQSPPSIAGQYLPQFLLGEMSLNSSQTKNSPKFWAGGNSPPKSTNLARSFSLSQYDNNQNQKYTHHGTDKSELLFNTNTPHHHHHTSGGGGGHHHHHHHHNSHGYSQELAKPNGPPLNRLLDTINKPSLTTPLQSNQTQNTTITTPFNDSRSKFHDRSSTNDLSFTPSSRLAAASPPSPTQIDPFYTHGDSIKYGDTFDDTWITVFGFPSSATSFILQEFSVYGQIIKYVPSGGNWMHIQYQTKFHAQKALSKNGKIIGNSMMIGVMPCIDKKVMQQSENTIKATNSQLDLSSSTASSAKTNEFLQQPASKISRTASLRTSIRPLSASNRNLDDDNYDPKLPRKNNNVISKAMEYMFGW